MESKARFRMPYCRERLGYMFFGFQIFTLSLSKSSNFILENNQLSQFLYSTPLPLPHSVDLEEHLRLPASPSWGQGSTEGREDGQEDRFLGCAHAHWAASSAQRGQGGKLPGVVTTCSWTMIWGDGTFQPYMDTDFFFFFFGGTWGMQKLQGQELNPSRCSDNTRSSTGCTTWELLKTNSDLDTVPAFSLFYTHELCSHVQAPPPSKWYFSFKKLLLALPVANIMQK